LRAIGWAAPREGGQLHFGAAPAAARETVEVSGEMFGKFW